MTFRIQFSCVVLALLGVAAEGQCTPEAGCACGLSTANVNRIEDKIRAGGAYMYAIPNMRCTNAGRARFQECGIPLNEDIFGPSDIASTWNNFGRTIDSTWKYMQCEHPVEEGGMQMHSYIFVDGKLKGDGFDVSKVGCPALAPKSMLKPQHRALSVGDMLVNRIKEGVEAEVDVF